MKKIRALLIVITVSLMPLLAADEPPEITLSEAIESAKNSNIPLQEAAITLQMAIRTQDARMTTFMPDISLTAGLGTGIDFPETIAGTSESYVFSGLTLNAGLSASFSFDGTMITDGESRRIEKEGASLDYQETWQTLEESITEAYWNISSAAVSINDAELLLEDARRQYESTNEMYQNGLTDELSMLQSELAMRQAEIQVNVLKDSRKQLMSSFMHSTGLSGDFNTEELPSPVLLDLPSPEELFETYSEGTLTVKSGRNDLESAENDVQEATLGTYVPIITASIGYTYQGSGYQNNNDYSSQANGLTGSIGITIPISSMLPGSETSVAIDNAKDNVAIAALELQNAKDTLLEEIRVSVDAINQYQENMKLQEATLATAEKTYELAVASYSSGLLDADELASIRTDLLSARMTMTTMETEHLVACVNLAYDLNISLAELQESFAQIKE